jgi:hypothetical protein
MTGITHFEEMFGGKVYRQLGQTARTKPNAEALADLWRSKGYYARVQRSGPGLYLVFVRAR